MLQPTYLLIHKCVKVHYVGYSRNYDNIIVNRGPFDAVYFNGELKFLGAPSDSKEVPGIQHYTIKHYEDLNPLLGKNWHYRGLNSNGDYGYVVLETIDFCIRKCKPLEEYVPAQEDGVSPCVSFIHTG